MQVVTEVLNMADSSVRDLGIGEVTREEDEGNVAYVFCLRKTGKVTQFEWRVPCCVEDLRGALYSRETSCIDEFL